jgi:threonyl-tRNA synthetase
MEPINMSHKRSEGGRTTESTGDSIKESGGMMGVCEGFSKAPSFIPERIQVWDEIMARQKEEIASFPKETI